MARYAKGLRAWGICQRSGKKVLLSDMVFDGQIKNLRVASDEYDPRHPQEQLLKMTDPQALWRPAPQDYPLTSPVLTGSVDFTGRTLNWTASQADVSVIGGYRLYRSLDTVLPYAYTLLQTFSNVYDYLGGLTSETLSYVDTESLTAGATPHYYVEAFTV
jgi:hypothetical protein